MKVVGVIQKQECHAYNMRKNPVPRKNNRGFTLFEMVVFIIVAAIIYSVAVNRFSEFPEAAERANFLSILTQLQTGINLEMMLGVSTGMIRNVPDYAGLNPMDMLLKAPSNYLGAFNNIDVNSLPRRSWYFDNNSSELVYLINEPDNAYLVINSTEIPTEEFRFKIVVTYRDPMTLANLTYDELEAAIADSEAEAGENSERLAKARISGAVLRPVNPFRWEGTGVIEGELINVNG